MNITTAGACTKCGWSQFTKSTVSTGVLLDDYKRLLLENRNLKEHIAELEEKLRAEKLLSEKLYLLMVDDPAIKKVADKVIAVYGRKECEK